MGKRILVFLALAMFLAASSALASSFTLTNYTTQVAPNMAAKGADGVDYSTNCWYDQIGDQDIFGTSGMTLTGDASEFTFKINTNFSGHASIGEEHYIGDLFLYAEDRLYGFDLGTWDSDNNFSEDNADFYLLDDSPITSHDKFEGTGLIYGAGYGYQELDGDKNVIDWTAGHPFAEPIVKINDNDAAKTDSLESATFSRSDNDDPSTYTYTLTGDFDLINTMDLNWGDDFEVLFATATCANSGMYAQVTTTPEPGTLLLFGTGLLGIAWLGRKRLHKRS